MTKGQSLIEDLERLRYSRTRLEAKLVELQVELTKLENCLNIYELKKKDLEIKIYKMSNDKHTNWWGYFFK
jgi:chromosome segregation ATPase